MNLLRSKINCLLGVLLLAGCSSYHVKPIYYKDGAQVNTTSCSGASWTQCYLNAGATCQRSGYEVLEKSSGIDHGFWSSRDVKELIFACKDKESKGAQ